MEKGASDHNEYDPIGDEFKHELDELYIKADEKAKEYWDKGFDELNNKAEFREREVAFSKDVYDELVHLRYDPTAAHIMKGVGFKPKEFIVIPGNGGRLEIGLEKKDMLLDKDKFQEMIRDASIHAKGKELAQEDLKDGKGSQSKKKFGFNR